MTKNRIAKEAVRKRMALTNETYSQALKALEELQERPLTVIELGEDGDAWLVEGTEDELEAREAIEKLLRSYGDEWLEESLEVLRELKPMKREDWF